MDMNEAFKEFYAEWEEIRKVNRSVRYYGPKPFKRGSIEYVTHWALWERMSEKVKLIEKIKDLDTEIQAIKQDAENRR